MRAVTVMVHGAILSYADPQEHRDSFGSSFIILSVPFHYQNCNPHSYKNWTHIFLYTCIIVVPMKSLAFLDGLHVVVKTNN